MNIPPEKMFPPSHQLSVNAVAFIILAAQGLISSAQLLILIKLNQDECWYGRGAKC